MSKDYPISNIRIIRYPTSRENMHGLCFCSALRGAARALLGKFDLQLNHHGMRACVVFFRELYPRILDTGVAGFQERGGFFADSNVKATLLGRIFVGKLFSCGECHCR